MWADTFTWDLSTNTGKATSATDNIVTITFGGSNLSAQKTYMGFKNGSTMSVSCVSGYSVSKIELTYASGYIPSSNSFSADPTGLNEACTEWSGNAASVVINNKTINNDTRITNVKVTYSAVSPTEYYYNIPIEDLRFEHMTYDPARSGVAGFNISTSGWQSYTNSGVSPYEYTILLSERSKENSSITISTANSSATIKQIVLVGAFGANTFENTTTSTENAYIPSGKDQIVWSNSTTPASSVTINISATDQPQISEIWVFTNTATGWDPSDNSKKTDVKLSFTPSSETVSINQTDYSIAGRLVNEASQYFRPDSYSVDNNSTGASYNTFHLSTGKVGVNTGSTTGKAYVKASFAGNQFFKAASDASYTLTIENNETHTTTISIDDMRISKTANTNGLGAGNDASPNFDRTLGGFNFQFRGGTNANSDGVKFNNSNFIILRNDNSDNTGSITITPNQSSGGNVSISKVEISTMSAYTNGEVTATGTEGNTTINNVSTYTFNNVNNNTFTITSVSGTVYITGFTIYYTDASNKLITTNVTPTITFMKNSASVNGTTESIASGDSYTSPTVTTNPAHFDISLNSNNTEVATVTTNNWSSNANLVSLQGGIGTAVITGSAAESTFFNAAVNATYTVEVTGTVSDKWNFTTLDVAKTINATDWDQNGEYYKNNFTTNTRFSATDITGTTWATSATESQIADLRFGRDNSNGLSSGNIRLYSSFMTFNNSAVVIAVPAGNDQKVLVTFEGSKIDFANATLEGDNTATSISSDSKTTATLVANTTTGYVILKVSSSSVKLYKLEVSGTTRGTISLRDNGSNKYEKYVGTGTTSSTDNHFNHRVTFTPSDGEANALTYANDAQYLHITSSDPSVLDVSNAYVVSGSFGNSSSFEFGNVIPKKAGTATLTVTFDGNDRYKSASYTSKTYTVYGPGQFLVKVDDQEIQHGQFSVINPIITDDLGRAIGIREYETGKYTTYVLGEDEDIPDYSEYFNFTFTPGAGTGENYEKIRMDGTTNKVLTEDNSTNPAVAAAVGATRIITVTATPKETYVSAFISEGAVTNTLTITIIEKIKNPQIHLYWDAACTKPISENYDESSEVKWRIKTENVTQSSDKQWIFNGSNFSSGFPNGRVIYAKAINPGDSIWFSYGQNASAKTIPANPSLDKNKRIFEYRRGLPIYIDDDLTTSGTLDSVTVNIVATTYNASTRKRALNGSVVRMRFPITSHARPDQPTYDPVSPDPNPSDNKDGRKMMNTSENVVAYGEGASKTTVGIGNLVYGKFSTSSVYTTEQLINENAVQSGINSVPVVSTEVNKRRFTAVQIRTDNPGEDYISTQTYTEYYYLFDTDLRLYSDAGKTTPLSEYNIDTKNASGAVSSSAPYYRVTWYNKRNYDDPKNYNLGVTQEVDTYDGKMSFAITGMNGFENTDLTIDNSTGVVTLASGSTSKEGWVKVTATYAGGEEHGGKSGEPQYKSTTDVSTADFYIYFVNSNNHKPRITPQTRNFAKNIKVTVAAPVTWKVKYVIDYSQDGTHYTTGTEIMDHGIELAASEITDYTSTITHTIGEKISDNTTAMEIGETVTVRAVAYDPSNTSTFSNVVSETYTKRAEIPDPIFDPDGTKEGGYIYNTNDLIVQIACAYAGSVIYYTITDLGSEHPDPVIGAANTYRYSGLSKVKVVGEKVIKAIAYDPELGIYSNVVTSTYSYSSEMLNPYFQISNDEGATWWGFSDATTWAQNGTEWKSSDQSHDVTPSTLIRIIDPNPVTGTVFYNVGPTSKVPADPSDDANSLVYKEGYPFTVGRSSISKAIVILEDAASHVSSATFTIPTSYGNVWEAVGETLTDSVGSGKKGIHIADGFVISTEKKLSVAHTGSKVNLKSIDKGHEGESDNMYAQKDITATFGGYELASWEEMTIADAAIGSPIDGIAEYNIKTINNTGIGNGNAKDETLENYNHIYSYKTAKDKKTAGSVTPATTHEKTFRLPAVGDFVRFEPEKDGDLTVWCLQQGALLYEDDKYFIPNVLRIRPVYMIDEQGNSLKVKTVNGVPQLWSAARLSENWSKIQATAATNGWKNSKWIGPNSDDYETTGEYVQYIRVSDGTLFNTVTEDEDHIIVDKLSKIPANADKSKYYKKLVNKGPNTTETAAIYQLYKADLDKNHVNIGDPIKPFAIHTGATISMNDAQLVDDSNDGTGYVLASGGYAKYTFEVKAGKSYYFFAQGSKIGIRGFQFVSTESGTRPEVSLDADGTSFKVGETSYTPADLKTAFADTPVNVTIKRTIKKDQWSTLVLPFSVSATQLEKLFGDETGTRAGAPEVEHYKDIVSPNTVVFKRHKYQMIVAGTPILIWSEKDVTDPKFDGVQIEADVVETMTGLTSDEYSFIGNFVRTDGAMHQYDYYFGKNDGKLYRYTGTADIAVNGSIAWLRPKTPSASRTLSLAFTSIEDDLDTDSGSTTGIIEIVNDDIFNGYNGQKTGKGVVYNLKGMKVSDGSLENLTKGVYIVNGKKVVVE